MENLTNKLVVLILVLFTVIFFPRWLRAGTVEGTIQGFTCVTQGIFCPKGKEDPMAAVERVFVLLTKDRKYYFVPNLDRAVLARHINDHVMITGPISPKYSAISARKLDVFNNGVWKTTWSLEDEIRERRESNN